MSDHETKEHSDFGGSVIGRVIACPGSVALCHTVPERRSSSYADEGTFAHALGEKALLLGVWDAQQFIGDKIESPKLASKKIVTQEMAIAVQAYLDAIQEELQRSPDPYIEIEQRFVLPISTAEPGEVFGANDCVIYHPSLGRLVVFDYKHGQGVSVSADNNEQLKFYAAGAALTHPDWRISEVVLVIVQPRAMDADRFDPAGVKPWPMDSFELIEFVGEVEEAVARAKVGDGAEAASQRMTVFGTSFSYTTEAGTFSLSPGKHCRWCPAAAICPAIEAQATAEMKLDFADIGDISPKNLPAPKELDTARIAALLRGFDVLDAWATQVREFAFGLLVQGVAVPGFKLVDRIGRRKWIDNEIEIAAYMEAMYGVEQADSLPPKLVTITEAERLIKARVTKKKERKAALDDVSLRFTLKDSSGQTMVPDTDRRDAVAAGASADFSGVQVDS